MAEQVHVGEGGSARKGARWPLVLTLAVVAVISLGIGGVVRWMQHENAQPLQIKTAGSQPKSVLEAQSLLATGNADEATKYIDNALADKSLSADERSLLYVERGKSAIEKGDYQSAADNYTKAWDTKQTFDTARKLGTVWQQLGDNAKALDFYKKAMGLNTKDRPTYESDNNVLQQMIDALEGKQ